MQRLLRTTGWLTTIASLALLGASTASAHHVSCSRDINNDGKVDKLDMKILDDAMGSRVGKAPYDERADFNEDGLVNKDDRDAFPHCTPLRSKR